MEQEAALNRQDYQLLQQIGSNIAYYRKQRRLTQKALAARANIGRVHLARVEIGIATASLPLLFTLSRELGIPLKALFDFPEEV